jgi:2-methylisoborneol synthase
VPMFSRMSPAEADTVAGRVMALLSDPRRPAPKALPLPTSPPPDGTPEGTVATASLVDRLVSGPLGLGTAGARFPWGVPSHPPLSEGREARPPLPDGRKALGTSAMRLVPPPLPEAASTPSAERGSDPGPEGLYSPPALRDDEALGELVNEGLVQWAAEVGIYPGQLERVRATNFGRLIMLTHPGSNDPDRLLAAAKCILAEWATDDHFLDDESLGADASVIGARLGITFTAIEPAHLPARYLPHLDQALADEPVAVAYRSAFEHLSRFATPTQVARLRHELTLMFMAYNHEAVWRTTGRIPRAWEYLVHRHENGFLPPMVLVDPVAGYELPAYEFADPNVRRVFSLAGLASVILNDLYSRSAETDADFDLPKVIAAEEGCTPEQAIERTVEIHSELMHAFEREAAVLATLGTPLLRRFLTDCWAWLGGSRQWHASTRRYHDGVAN